MKADIKWLDDPEVFQVNRENAHSDHVVYASRQEAESGKSSLSQNLDGEWDFFYSVNAKDRPEEFYRDDFTTEGFGKIMVPGHIELAGYDKIHYINTMYPWEGHVYRRPGCSFSEASYNPVGSYRRSFDLEKGLIGKRVTICFEGVEQAVYVWLNGEFVGYAEDSFTPSEFDLTPYIKEKGNLLAVEVHKRSTAAFLEDQDFFRFFGIFRSVVLHAKPVVHVEDMWARPMLEEDNISGSLELDIRLSYAECSGETALRRAESVQITLADAKNRVCLQKTLPLEDSEKLAGKTQRGLERNYELKLEKESLGKVDVWNCGNPYLYTLFIEVLDESGSSIEAVPYRIGFRRIEIKDKIILLNGKRLLIKGVNRHEWSAESGRCIEMKEMQEDMDIILRNHINAVRTCHYPDQIPWYYLCDEKGIYVMAETNLESHGSWQKLGAVEPSWNVPGSFPEWKEVVMDRAISNFEWLKNHPSILFWSLGNESYVGDNIESMNRYYKDKDAGRLVHYEGVFYNNAYRDTVSDVESRMYATPEQIVEYLEAEPDKPFMLCEYMHDMGNSLGGMNSYMELFDQYKMYQGGFIWDFIDQALWAEDEVSGEKVLRYGGDFDDRPADYAFSGNGIVFADRIEKPAMQEVKYYYGKY